MAATDDDDPHIKQSGAPVPVGNMTHGQDVYNFIVSKSICVAEPADSLNCLRRLPYGVLRNIVDHLPAYYFPRVDGVFLTQPPFEAIQNGNISRIPIVIGTFCYSDRVP